MAELTTPEHLRATHAERAVLGCIFTDESSIDLISATLEPDDFHDLRHSYIYQAILSAYKQGLGLNVISVIEELKRGSRLQEVGGEVYLYELSEEVASAFQAEHYAMLVSRAAEVRRLLTVCAQVIEKGQRGSFEHPDELFEEAQQRIFQLGSKKARQDFMTFSDAVTEALEKVKLAFHTQSRVTGTPTGFTALDHKTAGFQPGDLVILAARPAMGKTALALNMAFNAATDSDHARSVIIFSLEMPTVQLATRILSSEAKISSESMKSGRMERFEIEQLSSTMNQIKTTSLFIDDTAGLSITDCRAKCRRLAAQAQDGRIPPVSLVIIDYLQLMKGPQGGSREQEISEISRSLKSLAKELNAPVIALSQLNRGVESRPNKRPLLSDLRESGAIEQDADIILFVYRDDYYNPESEDKGLAELIIAKHRSGGLGTIKLQFVGAHTRFNNYEVDHDDGF